MLASGTTRTSTPTVGILGAGWIRHVSALSLSLSPILDDLGIPYKIIEGRERVGGRLYTYTFRNNLKTGVSYDY